MAVGSLIGFNMRQQAVALSLACFLYFMAYLEQYFTNYLYLAKINAVNEGLWLVASLCIISSLLGGRAFWNVEVLGMPVSYSILGLEITLFFVSMRKHIDKILAASDLHTLVFSIGFHLFFIFVNLVAYFIFRLHDYSYMYILAFNVAKATIVCQLSHVLEVKYNPYRLVNVFIGVLAIVGLGLPQLRQPTLILAFLDFAWFAGITIRKVSITLGVNVCLVI